MRTRVRPCLRPPRSLRPSFPLCSPRARTAARTVVLTATVLAALAGAHPGGVAAPVQAGPGLFLTVSGAEDTWIRGVSLRCEPESGGQHPQAAGACAALEEAGGDPDALAGRPGACTLERDPVSVSANGAYGGRPVAWKKTFPNACALHRATTPVFAF